VTPSAATTPEEFFAGHDEALAAFRRVQDLLARAGFTLTIRTSKSQVAFRRRRGFAYLWMPGQYLRRPAAEVVLSIALDRLIRSSRFKEVVQLTSSVWMHHLEIRDLADLDDEVAGWLQEAAEHAG
jgi:hypothetical protein